MNPRALALQRRFQTPLLAAAILTLPALLLEDSSRRGPLHVIGYAAGVVFWLFFLLEMVVMLAVVDSRAEWLREHPLDVAIVIFTPPFLSSGIQGLRVLRVLRLLRMFRLASFARRLFTTEGVRYASVLAALVLFTSAEAFSSAEKVSYGNALYWALTTMTTVGYGDITPHTATAKVVASLVMVVGIGFFAVLTGAIAQRFLAGDVLELAEEERDLLTQIRGISERLRQLEHLVLSERRQSS